jgi:mRNA-degrading endonuclease toxin of MazEF toxin-antitoxin module
VRRGEVWWGNPPLAGGSRKRRPFLIVSNDAFNCNDLYPKVMVVHLTSVKRRRSYPWEVSVPRDSAGLTVPSVVKCSEIYTLLKVHLTAAAGTMSRQLMARVDQALAVALDVAPR